MKKLSEIYSTFFLLNFLILFSPSLAKDKNGIKKEFCSQRDNKNVYLFTLTNDNGLIAELTNYGGIITALYVPDKNGKSDNIVLGLPNLNSYLSNDYFKSNPRFGALIGRYANRIKNASFNLDGITYKLTVNSRQKHHIHGGEIGFDRVVWDPETLITKQGPTLKLSYMCPDGHEGFPGNLSITVIYTLTNENEFQIDYYAETDKPTIVNFTNHSYFNLAGEGNGNILDHHIKINADQYTPADDERIPTGEIKDVANTPFDFRNMEIIGARIDQFSYGYDINYVLKKSSDELGFAAKVYEQNSGRVMEVFTTEPGMQFYTAKSLNGKYSGRNGKKYESSYGFCLETENFPDSPNKLNFPSPILRPEEKFHSTTIYKFSINKKQ